MDGCGSHRDKVALHSCYFCFKSKRPVNPAYPEELNTLGDHLRKVRLDRNLSQPDVAKLLGVTTDTVTNWELNRNQPRAKFVNKIISFLDYIPFRNLINDTLSEKTIEQGLKSPT
ncbi:MAG: XRE family transcriptional regulator [Bacteroidetes bacterium]|nr:MAG: XRE family transcriptional regulator [Bacteroidota bacterium]